MTESQKVLIKDKLAQDIKSLKEEIAALEENTQIIEPSCALGKLGHSELMVDMQIYEKTLSEARIRLSKLIISSNHIENDLFGVCLECEEEIPFARMMLVPESTYCVSCLEEI